MGSFVSNRWLSGWRRQETTGERAHRWSRGLVAFTAISSLQGPSRPAAVILLVATLCAGTASAQSVTGAAWARAGTLAGVVVDETEAVLPGARLVAVNTLTGTLREATTGGDGWFLMPLLPPGAYVMTAEREGFAPVEIRNIELGDADYLVLRLPMRLGGVAETVSVESGWLALDLDARILVPAVTQPVQGVRVGGELQRRLPLSPGREYADAARLAPGVIAALSGLYVHGVADDAAIILVDGADVSSPMAGGIDRLRIASEAIEAVEVRTAGMDASVPLSQAALISVVTKSGTNLFRGVTGGQWGGSGWMALNEPDFVPTSRAQADAALGGPVARDRWWFFGAYRGTSVGGDLPVDRSRVAVLSALFPGRPVSDEHASATSHAMFGKLNARFSERHDIVAFSQRDTSYSAGSEPNFHVGPLARTANGGNAYSARWSSVWSDTLMTRVSASFNDKTAGSQVPVEVEGAALTVYRTVRPSGTSLAGSESLGVLDEGADCCYTRPAGKLTLTADLTWYRHARGSHEIQAGIFSQPYARVARAYANGPGGLVSESAVLKDPDNPAAGFVPFARAFVAPGATTMQDLRSQDHAVYVQDTWVPSRWLAIAAGLRVDWIQDRDRTSGLVGREAWAVGPRLSVVLQPTPRNVLRAGWGRVHESPTASRLDPPASVMREGWYEYDNDLDGVFETRVGDGRVHVDDYLDLERGQPYVDELTLGYRRELPGRLVLGADFVARDYRAIPITRSGALAYVDGRIIRTDSGVARVTANTWNHPKVMDLAVQLTKQTARLQLSAAYNRNWRQIEGTWAPGDPAAVLQPSTFANDAGIDGVRFARDNSLSGSAGTGTYGWADHSAAIAASYIGPGGIAMAATYRVQSGPWSGPILTMVEPDPRFGPPVIEISGRNIPNPDPRATTLRFAYQTRGEGQLRLPAVHEMNVRIGLRRTTRWGRLEPALDVYNVANAAGSISWASGANEMFNPNFGRPYRKQAPRSASVSLRFVF